MKYLFRLTSFLSMFLGMGYYFLLDDATKAICWMSFAVVEFLLANSFPRSYRN